MSRGIDFAAGEELGAILQGSLDVLPIELLAPLDYAKLRLLLCCLPVLDLDGGGRECT